MSDERIDEDALLSVMCRRVRAARRALDLSQKELASRFERTHGWLGPIEAGRSFPPPFLILALHRATGHPLAWFFGEGPDIPTAN